MVFRWIYVDQSLVVNVEIRMLRVCDVPVSYAKVVGNGYGSICACAKLCCAGLQVFE